jgi:hypothetical protein
VSWTVLTKATPRRAAPKSKKALPQTYTNYDGTGN